MAATKEYRLQIKEDAVVLLDQDIYNDNTVVVNGGEQQSQVPKMQTICTITSMLLSAMRNYGITEIRMKKV